MAYPGENGNYQISVTTNYVVTKSYFGDLNFSVFRIPYGYNNLTFLNNGYEVVGGGGSGGTGENASSNQLASDGQQAIRNFALNLTLKNYGNLQGGGGGGGATFTIPFGGGVVYRSGETGGNNLNPIGGNAGSVPIGGVGGDYGGNAGTNGTNEFNIFGTLIASGGGGGGGGGGGYGGSSGSSTHQNLRGGNGGYSVVNNGSIIIYNSQGGSNGYPLYLFNFGTFNTYYIKITSSTDYGQLIHYQINPANLNFGIDESSEMNITGVQTLTNVIVDVNKKLTINQTSGTFTNSSGIITYYWKLSNSNGNYNLKMYPVVTTGYTTNLTGATAKKDLSQIFQPLTSSTTVNSTGYTINLSGVKTDLCQIFQPLTTASSLPLTGYTTSYNNNYSNKDLTNIFESLNN